MTGLSVFFLFGRTRGAPITCTSSRTELNTGPLPVAYDCRGTRLQPIQGMQIHSSDGIWSRRLALTDRITSQPSSVVSQYTWKRVDSSVNRAIGTPTANASAGQGIDCQVRNSLKAYEVLAMCGMLPDSDELNPPVFASSVTCDQKLASNETPSASRHSYAHTHCRNYHQFRAGIVRSSNALENIRSLYMS